MSAIISNVASQTVGVRHVFNAATTVAVRHALIVQPATNIGSLQNTVNCALSKRRGVRWRPHMVSRPPFVCRVWRADNYVVGAKEKRSPSMRLYYVNEENPHPVAGGCVDDAMNSFCAWNDVRRMRGICRTIFDVNVWSGSRACHDCSL